MKHKSASIQPDLFEQEEPRAYGLLASAGCKINIARARELMAAPIPGRSAGSARHSRSAHHDRSSSAMPVLRRPHDHCRDLCAQRRTARPALRCRDQDVMR